MALTVDPNTDAPGDDDELVDPSRAPVQTPGTSNKFFTTDTEEELYEENKKLHTVLRKLDNFLRVQHPELLCTMQKNEPLRRDGKRSGHGAWKFSSHVN